MAELDALLAAQPVAHALSFALEAALVQWLAARAGQPVWQWLGVPAPAAGGAHGVFAAHHGAGRGGRVPARAATLPGFSC